MKLKYQILWIENEEDWVQSIEDQIQEYLEELGFIYNMTLIGKEENNVAYNDYDLILMDLNLANQTNGAELISKIRDLGVYTNVVFYSASGTEVLRKQGLEYQLDGVYYSGRTPDALFVKKVKDVINATIKKVQDLDNIRGLVMAEVSELDGKMVEIINKYYVENATEELKNLFHKHITKKQEEKIKKALEGCNQPNKSCTHIWKNKEIKEIMPDLEASQLAKAIMYIIPEHLYTPKRQNFFEDYKNEIFEIRNELAHCISIKENGKEILKTRKGDKTFSEDDIKTIRKNILKYSSLFNRLLGEQ